MLDTGTATEVSKGYDILRVFSASSAGTATGSAEESATAIRESRSARLLQLGCLLHVFHPTVPCVRHFKPGFCLVYVCTLGS